MGQGKTMGKRITEELKRHAPFTALGAATGIIIMAIVVFSDIPSNVSNAIFYTLHPIHVVLSALVTTAMYRKYRKGKVWVAILIGWTGSIGIATISDAIIPYLGGSLLHVQIEFHVPFIETSKMPFIGIEKWKLVNSAALIGVAIGYWKQITRIPHFGHVLLSTWASLFYFVTFGIADWIPLLPFIFLFLFIAVWIPCCMSDIVYPLLFVTREERTSLPDRGEKDSPLAQPSEHS
ncbi:MAG: hypothetical protein SU899_06280 [Chloroflexota bacterium]|nr:hypothetical protein [Chloroflexota bacterium]